MRIITWIELPEVVEVSIQTSIITTEYVQFSIVSNFQREIKKNVKRKTT